jgi:hypothetical protein
LSWFKSDEAAYLERGLALTTDNVGAVDVSRAGWIVLNAFVQRVDIFAGGAPLKLIGVPLLLIAVLYVWRVFEKRNGVFWLPIALPYLCLVAVENLRDTLILCLTAVLCLALYERRASGVLRAVLAAGLLLVSRPFVLAVVILGFGLERAWSAARRFHLLSVPSRSGLRIGLATIIVACTLAVAGPVVVNLVDRYEYYLTFLLAGRHEDIGVERVGRLTGNRMVDFAVGAARYAFTPLPTSLAARMVKGGTEQWGLLDDVVRLGNQLTYFALLAALALRWRRVWRGLGTTDAPQRLLLFSLAAMWPIYSWQLFGATHQRLKLPLQIVVYLLVLLSADTAVRERRDRVSAPQ